MDLHQVSLLDSNDVFVLLMLYLLSLASRSILKTLTSTCTQQRKRLVGSELCLSKHPDTLRLNRFQVHFLNEDEIVEAVCAHIQEILIDSNSSRTFDLQVNSCLFVFPHRVAG